MDGLTGGSAFRHGVASGDPTSRRVVIWTRVSGASGTTPVPVRLRILEDPTVDALDKRLPGQALTGSMSVHHGAPRLVVEDVATPDAASLRVPVA